MSRVEQEMVFAAPVERAFDVIVDYERYPEFLPEMREVQVLSREDHIVVVKFDLEIMMRISYTLRFEEKRPTSVSWTLKEAKMLAANIGGWQLAAVDGNTTRAIYGLDVQLRGLIPKSVSNRLIGTTLPETMARFKQRIEGRSRAA
jgi:coenzyme Q-binding protein COQ10